ncbi:MAG: cysteine hydrolase family protein [Gammaproteobacteria bacterium]
MSKAQPFTKPNWSLAAGHTALILIDLQNDVLSDQGWYAKSGIDITHMQRVIEPTKKMLKAARAKGVPVIWVRHGLTNEFDAGIFWDSRPFLHGGGFRIGSWGHGVLDELDVRDDDWIIDKRRLSAFFNSSLDTVLRGLGAETLLISGVLTNQCVASTIKDAMFRDYKAFMVEDCCGTTLPDLHAPTVRMCEVGWGVVWSLDETLAGLSKLPERTSRVA